MISDPGGHDEAGFRAVPGPASSAGPGRLRSLKSALAWLLVAVLAPVVAAGSAFVAMEWVDERDQALRRLQDQARSLRIAVDRELALDQAVLRALAASRDVDDRNWARLHAAARQTAAVRPDSWFLLVDRDGEQIVNTARPFGTPLPNMKRHPPAETHVEWQGRRIPNLQIDVILKVFSDGEPAFAGLGYGPVVKRPTVGSAVPVLRDDRVAYSLALAYGVEFFQSLLRGQDVSPRMVEAIVDGTGLIVARSRRPEQFVGMPATEPLGRGGADLPPEGVGRARTLEGVESFFAFSRSTVNDWTVAVAMPRDAVLAPAWRALAWSSAFLLVSALVGVLFAIRLWRRLALPLDALLRQARASDESMPRVPATDIAEVAELGRVLTEAARNEQRRRRTESDREEARRALQEANERLTRADERRTEFLSMLSHELRNPLAPIANSVKVLAVADDRPELRAQARAVIARQTAHLARLISDLLDATRISSGKLHVEMSEVTVQSIVERAVEIVRPLLDEKRIELDLAMPAHEVRLRADSTRIAQVVSNLLHNAAKFSERGSVIALRARRDGAHVEIGIEDRGQGIEPELLPQVFDLFTQGRQSDARTEGGLGVGLALVRHIVVLHGGAVVAHSDGPGHGSRFVVRLPCL